VAARDGHTCELCQPMDGKVFKLSERMVGVTAPPIHPNCRCATVPWYDDTDLLEGADEEFRKNP
jgi:SPP1 gp7 family putative phage head morphogenesis protein